MTLQELDAFVKKAPALSILGMDEALEKIWIRGLGTDPQMRTVVAMIYEIDLADLPKITEDNRSPTATQFAWAEYPRTS